MVTALAELVVERLLIVAAVVVLALAVAAVAGRRSRPVPVRTQFHVPAQLHRPDFPDPEAEWLVAIFTSATCHTCGDVVAKATHLRSHAVAVVEVEVGTDRELHDRYGIDGVPTTVVAAVDGVVRRAFLGPVTATDLWAAVAELRQPGSIPEACHEQRPGTPTH